MHKRSENGRRKTPEILETSPSCAVSHHYLNRLFHEVDLPEVSACMVANSDASSCWSCLAQRQVLSLDKAPLAHCRRSSNSELKLGGGSSTYCMCHHHMMLKHSLSLLRQ